MFLESEPQFMSTAKVYFPNVNTNKGRQSTENWNYWRV